MLWQRPCRSWISAKAWSEICQAATISDAFQNLPRDVATDVPAWKAFFDSSEPQNTPLPEPYGTSLKEFDKLLVIRMLRPDKLIPSVCAAA
jgi:dynein heavy chain